MAAEHIPVLNFHSGIFLFCQFIVLTVVLDAYKFINTYTYTYTRSIWL